ncbi:MAG TPA: FG-GAP-like repeat-containing protein [Ignavibacteria bacterium]|nr:FG-GAP-like repeat-containing protein [Ignavibacteria bacterium]
MKNKFTKSGIGKTPGKNIYRENSDMKSLKTLLTFVFIFFAYGVFAQPVISSFSPQSGPTYNTFAVKANQTLPPVITAFSPLSGPSGTIVTLTGSGFNTTASNNIVFFGAALASVSSSTDASISVIVPQGANYQFISVTNVESNLTAYSSMPFITTYPGGCKTDFATGISFSAGTTAYSLCIGDLDKDGKTDMVVGNNGSNTVSVLRNITTTSSGISFAAKVEFGTGTSPRSISIGDIDGDGKPDLVVTNSGNNTVSVFRNTSTPGIINAGSFAAKIDFATGSSPWSVSVNDINADGKPDLAIANNLSGTISVLLNTSTSGVISFLSKVDFGTGSSPYSVSIGDLDGDGKPDMAVANNGNNTASVFQNTSTTGGLSFASRVDFSAGSGPISISIGDIDGDAKPDLALANISGSSTSVFRNTSTPGIINAGSFAARVDFAAGGAPQIVSIGDINGDGKQDLAVANFSSNLVSVLRNTSVPGTISFSAKVDLSSSQPSSVKIGDLDGDGKSEIAAPNYNVNSVSIFRNLGLTPVLQTSISGNGNPITNGSTTPSLTNLTDFGNVAIVGNLNRTYTFQNTSTDSLTVDSIKITGADSILFTAGSLTPPGKIAPGGSKTFNVTFSPVSSGLKNATVRVYSNTNSGTPCLIQQTYSFAISGTGFYAVQTNVLNFDGVNDKVDLPFTLSQNLTAPTVSEFTIEYWFKGSLIQSAVRFQTGAGYIVAGWGATPGSEKHIISTDGGTSGGISVGAGVSDGSWHHVAMTWKKNTVNGFKSFLDGALVQQRNSSNNNLPFMSSSGFLGGYYGGEFTNGTLDEVRIWNRELSQTEISTNRFLQISSGTGLLASYHFNQGFAGGNNTGITLLIDATANYYNGTLYNFTLNGPTSNFVGTGPGLIPLPSYLNIKVIPEGFYKVGSDQLNMKDTVRAYLQSIISPYNTIDSAIAVIDSVTLTGSFIFTNAPGGTYYIKVKHRNSIITWSRLGGEFLIQEFPMDYNFSSTASQAFGHNQVLVNPSPVRYAIYSGDVNQDGSIDLNDVLSVYNASSVFSSGYVVNDVNGDNLVDLNDIILAYNNSAAFVAVVRP